MAALGVSSHMGAHRVWSAATALVLGLGCGNGIPDPKPSPHLEHLTGLFQYRAYDESGRALLVGTVTLAVATDSTLTGSWDIRWAPGADTTTIVGPQVGTGTLAGRSGAEHGTIDLNPGWADNNVYLLMDQTDEGLLAGEWQHSTLLGPVAQGRFKLQRLTR